MTTPDRHVPRRSSRRWLALTLLLLASACDAPEHVGRYTLRTVGGAQLPWLYAQTSMGVRTELTAATLRLNDNNTFSYVYDWRVTSADGVRTERATGEGTYTLSGTAIEMRGNGGASPGTLSGNTLRLTMSEVEWLYER